MTLHSDKLEHVGPNREGRRYFYRFAAGRYFVTVVYDWHKNKAYVGAKYFHEMPIALPLTKDGATPENAERAARAYVKAQGVA